MKDKFEIHVVMPRESFHLYRCAYSERQALERTVSEIAKKHGVLKPVVWSYIKEHPNCYKIEKIGGNHDLRNREGDKDASKETTEVSV